MSEPAQKCENNTIFKQNCTLKLCFAFDILGSCCFGLRGNLDYPDFLNKKFYNVNYKSNFLPENNIAMHFGVGIFIFHNFW